MGHHQQEGEHQPCPPHHPHQAPRPSSQNLHHQPVLTSRLTTSPIHQSSNLTTSSQSKSNGLPNRLSWTRQRLYILQRHTNAIITSKKENINHVLLIIHIKLDHHLTKDELQPYLTTILSTTINTPKSAHLQPSSTSV